MEKIPSPEMLAFPYLINKIMRDMKRTDMPDEDAELKRDAIVSALEDVCRRINEEFE